VINAPTRAVVRFDFTLRAFLLSAMRPVVSSKLPGPIRLLITRDVHGASYFSDFPAINDFPPRRPAAMR